MPDANPCPFCLGLSAKLDEALRKHRQLELQRAAALRDSDWEAADDLTQALGRAVTAIADASTAEQRHRVKDQVA